jgi:hypothetical protein
LVRKGRKRGEEEERTNDGLLWRDSTFPTQPLTFGDVRNAVAICATRNIDEYLSGLLGEETWKKKKQTKTHLDAPPSYTHRKRQSRSNSRSRRRRKSHTCCPRTEVPAPSSECFSSACPVVSLLFVRGGGERGRVRRTRSNHSFSILSMMISKTS